MLDYKYIGIVNHAIVAIRIRTLASVQDYIREYFYHHTRDRCMRWPHPTHMFTRLTCPTCSPVSHVPHVHPTRMSHMFTRLTCATCSPDSHVSHVHPTHMSHMFTRLTCPTCSPDSSVEPPTI
ncbi:hypothetical protein J6590_039334 [Homalodisca vitripennis]|nr:hypothetical protein J6590_039334 [Homalodisca vitripennis]